MTKKAADKKASPRKRGRPTDYTADIAEIICARLADGESMVTMCKDEDMPSRATVFRWLAAREEFRDKYARAREAQADKLAEEIVMIADTPTIGVKTKMNDKGELEFIEGDMIEHRRLQVDARKWYASKLAPKKYGDKTTIAGDQENPLAVLTMEQIAANPRSRIGVA